MILTSRSRARPLAYNVHYAGYIYTSNLLNLQSCVNPAPIALPSELTKITSPLIPQAWTYFLQFHPDQDYTQYLLAGITHGFWVGFQYASSSQELD